ncbi:MAG: hypothetical protein ACE5Q6_19220, partial [Dehalococcoidia bacterium]
MPIDVPPLDNRDYADILQDALARIPVHNPEWTNFNDSDPGVTILQLFAFMTESILYRANQIPERNRLKFLQLLGIPLQPATAAQGFVTITNERGPLETATFGRLDVRAGPVRFRTTQGLDVLPIEAQVFYKDPVPDPGPDVDLYNQLYSDLLEEGHSLARFYISTPMPQPEAGGVLPEVNLAETVDGCLWIALLARPGDNVDDVRNAIANKVLTVGVMPRLDDTEGARVEAGQTTRSETPSPVRWEIAQVPSDGSNAAGYRSLDAKDVSILNTPGLVELTLPAREQLTTWNWNELEPGLEGTGEYPPSLADTNIGDRVVTWIRLRVSTGPSDSTVRARLSWLGINATMVQQRVRVPDELVGTGNGEPDQCFRLANPQVLAESLVLTVGGEKWCRINDIMAADPEVPVNEPRRLIYRGD